MPFPTVLSRPSAGRGDAPPPSAATRWWRSLFWKYLGAMLAASLAGTLLLAVLDLAGAGRELRRAFEPAALAPRMAREAAALGPLAGVDAGRQAQCETLMLGLLLRMADPELRMWADYDGMAGASRDGRLALRYRRADGSGCQYPARAGARLEAAMGAAAPGRPAGRLPDAPPPGRWEDLTRPWTLAVAIHPAQEPGATLTLGMDARSPLSMLGRLTRGELLDLLCYLLIISAMSALTVAVLLVGRIRRTGRAAETWAAGDLALRINDHGGDELSRLSQRFDRMADALGEVIEVKQALAAAQERNRLARDLHDTAKQRAFALGLQLSVLRHLTGGQGEAQEMVQTALQLTSRLQQDLADIIQRFGATTIVEAGLAGTLRDSLELMLSGSGIDWSLRLTPQDEARLCARPDVAGQLLLLTTEAAANVLRHSGASLLEVDFACAGDRACWSVRDNGRGFDPDRGGGTGMGLANMQLRARALPAGELEIRSGPGKGVLVCVTFRMEPGANPDASQEEIPEGKQDEQMGCRT
ncbi:histidine kinase [Cupriavidus sp. USMAHM13]|uniref:histidine kinase n=1 Tax=Cupriavidus sp. USMAHM13 TaxID=1389192 RepID=UPI000AF0E3E9|nr:histidine kinase [Cupriavidus sp. USMAHM13]